MTVHVAALLAPLAERQGFWRFVFTPWEWRVSVLYRRAMFYLAVKRAK